MPQWKQFSGNWTLTQQAQALAAGTWTGIPQNELYGWGSSDRGQLGQNDRVTQSSPVQITGTNWLDIGSGEYHSIATTDDGKLWTWGDNGSGQLGQNDSHTLDRSSPVQVGSLTTWSKVAASITNSYAIKTDGTMWAWGQGGNGRIGDNSDTKRSSPVQIGSLTTWSKVSTGWYHCLAIKTDGTLWGWGRNDAGQLGVNNRDNYSSPIQIGSLTTWDKVQGGRRFTLAVKTDNTLWAWGENWFSGGQLGLGDKVYRSSPVQVGALTNWATPTCGRESSYCVKTDGTLWSWGDNSSYGQLGHDNVIDVSSPVQVGSLTDWSQPGASQYAGFCVKTDGTLWSWGGNISGQLGQNDTTNRQSPVQIGSLTTWSKIVPMSPTYGGLLAFVQSRTGM